MRATQQQVFVPSDEKSAHATWRDDVVGIFPNEENIMRLLDAVLEEQNEEWLLQNRYLPQQSMAEINRVSDEVIEALPLNA